VAKLIPIKIVRSMKKLRSLGWSLPEIHKKYKVGYGTVYRHIKEVQILPKYRKIWLEKRKGSVKRKIIAEKEARSRAIKTIKNKNISSDQHKLFASMPNTLIIYLIDELNQSSEIMLFKKVTSFKNNLKIEAIIDL